VVATCAILVALNFVAMALNLGERRLQQQAETGVPQVTKIHDFLSALRLVGLVSAIVAVAFLVVEVGWSIKRRTRRRVAQDGESGVEPLLWNVSHGAYSLYWLTLVASFGLATFARGSLHVGMKRSDFVDYRTYLAAGNALRAVMWGCWVVLVRKSTVIQDRRESLTNGNRTQIFV
jgi:hypothetical protein